MQPSKSNLDDTFPYVPSTTTDVGATWRRFGWKPTTDEERQTRQKLTEARPGAPAVELKLSVAA